MGNWAGALEGAASGLDNMTKLKMTEAEMAYKEMAEQNRQRWQSDEASKERDWKSDENFIDRDWRTTERTSEQDWKTDEAELDREVKREDLALGRDRLDEDREYRRGVLEDRQNRTEAYAEKTTGGWSEQKEQEATLKALEGIDKERSELDADLVMSDEKKAQKLQELEAKRNRIIDYGATGSIAHERVSKVFGNNPELEPIAQAYASMTQDQRAQVDQKVAKLRKSNGAAASYVMAIQEAMSGGQTEQRRGPDTTLEKSIGTDPASEEEMGLPPDTGDVASAAGTQEVEGKVKAPTKDFLTGPPDVGANMGPQPAAPKPSRAKADTTVPALEAAKPVRESMGKMQKKYSDRESSRVVQAAQRWTEDNESIDGKQRTLMKRMHSKKEMASILKEAGYSTNMVEKFLQYIYG